MNNIMIVGEHTQYNTTIQDYGKLSHLYDILCLHSFFFVLIHSTVYVFIVYG